MTAWGQKCVREGEGPRVNVSGQSGWVGWQWINEPLEQHTWGAEAGWLV